MAKEVKSKQKKMNVRVDFTPMVDMLMLLITFFMLCTTLSKPSTMELTMPSKDVNQPDVKKNEAKESHSITIFIGRISLLLSLLRMNLSMSTITRASIVDASRTVRKKRQPKALTLRIGLQR